MTTTYKGFHGTKEEYIAMTISTLVFWCKSFADASTAQKVAFMDAISNSESVLVSEGFGWEEIEEIENKAYAA